MSIYLHCSELPDLIALDFVLVILYIYFLNLLKLTVVSVPGF